MSDMSVGLIIQRIKDASPRSKIAVFESPRFLELNAVFADTVMSARQIKLGRGFGGEKLIGVYDKHSNLYEVERKLRSHLRTFRANG